MTGKNFTTSFSVNDKPEAVYAAICNPRGWWSADIKGDTDRLNAVFYYHYKDKHQTTFQVTELVPGKKVVWHVLYNNFTFTKDKTEWNGNDVVFEIAEKNGKTELRFTQVGLVPEHECFKACSEGWSLFINASLRGLITTGKGEPLPVDQMISSAA